MPSYIGGKGGAGVVQKIINQMPPHRVYIEPFLGAGAVLRAKRPADLTIGVELSPHVLREHWRGDEIPGLTLLNGDGLEYLAGYPWAGGELIYLDPPYLLSTRSTKRAYYDCEMLGEPEHLELLALAKSIPAPVLISGYASELYSRVLAGWRCITFNSQTRGGPAVESLWLNYPEPAALHDYRYLGETFREREKLTRRALLAALAEL